MTTKIKASFQYTGHGWRYDECPFKNRTQTIKAIEEAKRKNDYATEIELKRFVDGYADMEKYAPVLQRAFNRYNSKRMQTLTRDQRLEEYNRLKYTAIEYRKLLEAYSFFAKGGKFGTYGGDEYETLINAVDGLLELDKCYAGYDETEPAFVFYFSNKGREYIEEMNKEFTENKEPEMPKNNNIFGAEVDLVYEIARENEAYEAWRAHAQDMKKYSDMLKEQEYANIAAEHSGKSYDACVKLNRIEEAVLDEYEHRTRPELIDVRAKLIDAASINGNAARAASKFLKKIEDIIKRMPRPEKEPSMDLMQNRRRKGSLATLADYGIPMCVQTLDARQTVSGTEYLFTVAEDPDRYYQLTPELIAQMQYDPITYFDCARFEIKKRREEHGRTHYTLKLM